MARGDAIYARWPEENAVGFPPPTQVFKYKRIRRKRPLKSGNSHTMCLPPLVRVRGCYLWFYMEPFVALRTGMAVDFSVRLRAYDRDGGFSKRLGTDYLKKHRRPHDDVYIALWVCSKSGLLWALESVIQARFQPLFNMAPPKITPGPYGWDSVVPPKGP